ncbi:large-conductance mechanosensitive channel [Dissophora ornata]|nr:hypothetical protein BGZ58_002353 [Dissophora ornata]KAI8600440.1 large-conductance mechanosensitive channel [Dissophora ornata]
MSSTGYGATSQNNNNNNNSNSNASKQNNGDVRVLTVGAGETSGASSSGAPSRGSNDYFRTSSDGNLIVTADGLVPTAGGGVRSRYGGNEKSSLGFQAYNSNDTDADDEHAHKHCYHGPGEHCSLPHMLQPLVSPTHHGAVENVVIKVRDSADITQKTLFYFWDEWKLFVNRGNVIDLGIGVVVGGAFSDIIDSFVADILTPPLSLWAAGTNLENSFIVLKHGRTPGRHYATYLEAQADGAVTENTGHFLKSCVNFVVIAFFLFWLVKAVHNVRKEKIRPPPKEKTCNWCREAIALDAFRCKYCQSFVKDIPGIEDAGVGMFVTIKQPRQNVATSSPSPAVNPTSTTATSGTSTPGTGKDAASTIGPKDGKKDGKKGGKKMEV